jgi:hypothetical protein
MVSTSFEFAIGLHGCCLALTELLLQLLCWRVEPESKGQFYMWLIIKIDVIIV